MACHLQRPTTIRPTSPSALPRIACAACPDEFCARCTDDGQCLECVSKAEPMYHKWGAGGWGFNASGACAPCATPDCVKCQADYRKCESCKPGMGLDSNEHCVPVRGRHTASGVLSRQVGDTW